MKNIFGAFSVAPANLKLKNGYTLFDWAMRQHCFPAFWGRSLTGANAITTDEVAFLKAKNCKVCLILDDVTELEISGCNGTEEAMRAINAAKALGVPQNNTVTLFVKVKDEWSVNHNWMISFAQALSNEGFIPGFIGNTDSSKNFVFDRQCGHFVNATTAFNQFGAIYGATQPKCDGVPQKWEPYCPSVLNQEHIGLWFCGTTTFDNLVMDDVYARDENALAIMW